MVGAKLVIFGSPSSQFLVQSCFLLFLRKARAIAAKALGEEANCGAVLEFPKFLRDGSSAVCLELPVNTATGPARRLRTTTLLEETDSADSRSLDALVPLVFDELREIARRQLGREHQNFTLQTTALVHEAYLRLVDDARVTRRGRAYFFAAAARAMRQVLVDAARRRRAAKRGGGAPLTSLTDDSVRVETYADKLLDLDRALDELGRINPRHLRVVECRFFGGMSVVETADALDVSERTVQADWAFARAWLYRALERTSGDG